MKLLRNNMYCSMFNSYPKNVTFFLKNAAFRIKAPINVVNHTICQKFGRYLLFDIVPLPAYNAFNLISKITFSRFVY